MSVLTLRLAGPLQSWGASARFARRTTESAPTKSGVIGLLAAAAGITREDDDNLAPLAALRFGVRIDQPGTRVRDFHTAHHQITGKAMPLSERFYLADAVFVAALEGEETLLTSLLAAVRAPAYPPFLGRRSCPPAQPVDMSLHHEANLIEALSAEPWQAAAWYRRRLRDQEQVPLTVLREADAADPNSNHMRDQPVSFSAAHRRHALRAVLGTSVDVPNPAAYRPPPAHDPFEALEEESA